MPEAEKSDQQKTKATTPEKRKMPKGGRKGGTIFPRIALRQALEYSKKLVSKTAVAPQTEATILAGVFNNAGSDGRIRASALKQFGLMEGTPAAYKATQLARDIEGAADETERSPLVRKAMLCPKLFRQLFDTYHGDEASKAKIRGRAQQLAVHPDLGDECADLFMASAETAGLASRANDGVRLVPASPAEGDEELIDSEPETDEESGVSDAGASNIGDEESMGTPTPPVEGNSTIKPAAPRPRTAADVTVNLTVDSSLDGDKLGKQLALLRSYGLI